jgi:hypothetical protein
MPEKFVDTRNVAKVHLPLLDDEARHLGLAGNYSSFPPHGKIGHDHGRISIKGMVAGQ